MYIYIYISVCKTAMLLYTYPNAIKFRFRQEANLLQSAIEALYTHACAHAGFELNFRTVYKNNMRFPLSLGNG